MAAQQRYLEPTSRSQELEPHARSQGWSWSSRGEPSSPAEDAAHAFRPDEDRNAPVYVISVAAELAGLHPQTLRAYEREGLLTPARTEGGTRRYSERDVERLRFIRTLTQDEGLNLAGVKVVLDLGEKLEGTRRRIGELEEMVRVLAERVEDQQRGDRFEIVKAPPSQMEVHALRRRTAQRGRPVQRARPMPPPDRQRADV